MDLREVDIMYSNRGVFEQFKSCRSIYGSNSYRMTETARDWISDHIQGEWDNLLWTSCGRGVRFRFELASDAMLFKLVWTGL